VTEGGEEDGAGSIKMTSEGASPSCLGVE
jgi:hypothetical protein